MSGTAFELYYDIFMMSVMCVVNYEYYMWYLFVRALYTSKTKKSGIPCVLKDTRQSNHKFAVYRAMDTRQSFKLRRVPGCRHTAKQRPALSVLVPSPSTPSDAFYRRVPRKAHGKELCRVPAIQHTAKPALPSHLVAVGVLPSAAHGKAFCRVFS